MQPTTDARAAWLTPDLLELLARSTEMRRGLAFVHRAPPECVAVSLGVPAYTVDRARDCLDRAELRAAILREYARLLDAPRPSAPPPALPVAKAGTNGVDDLIREAEAHPLGVRMIACAPIETVAITFGVHPRVVDAAREVLARRGIVDDDSSREG